MAIDGNNNLDFLQTETEKASHRQYTTGFYFGAENKECLETSMPIQTHEFVAVVLEDAQNGVVKIQQRNRFKQGDVLEVLSPSHQTFNQQIVVENLKNINGETVEDAKQVQQTLFLTTTLPLLKGDILRKQL